MDRTTVEELNEKFGIEGELGFTEMDGDLIFMTVSNPYADADICLYGAHVTSFKPRRTLDLLWMSSESNFEVGKPIRGGIPVCFPWFGPHQSDPKMPMHGFARLMYWEVLSTSINAHHESVIQLGLSATEWTRSYWPYDFSAILTMVIGKKLSVNLQITNRSHESFTYTCALHTYYSLSSIGGISLEGLSGLTYFNQLTGEKELQTENQLVIKGALTRHYLNAETPVVINDPAFHRRIKADKAGSKVTTVWNPGAEASAIIADLPDDGFEAFICVEATNAYDFPVHLNPGESFETAAIIGLLDAEE